MSWQRQQQQPPTTFQANSTGVPEQPQPVQPDQIEHTATQSEIYPTALYSHYISQAQLPQTNPQSAVYTNITGDVRSLESQQHQNYQQHHPHHHQQHYPQQTYYPHTPYLQSSLYQQPMHPGQYAEQQVLSPTPFHSYFGNIHGANSAIRSGIPAIQNIPLSQPVQNQASTTPLSGGMPGWQAHDGWTHSMPHTFLQQQTPVYAGTPFDNQSSSFPSVSHIVASQQQQQQPQQQLPNFANTAFAKQAKGSESRSHQDYNGAFRGASRQQSSPKRPHSTQKSKSPLDPRRTNITKAVVQRRKNVVAPLQQPVRDKSLSTKTTIASDSPANAEHRAPDIIELESPQAAPDSCCGPDTLEVVQEKSCNFEDERKKRLVDALMSPDELFNPSWSPYRANYWHPVSMRAHFAQLVEECEETTKREQTQWETERLKKEKNEIQKKENSRFNWNL